MQQNRLKLILFTLLFTSCTSAQKQTNTSSADVYRDIASFGNDNNFIPDDGSGPCVEKNLSVRNALRQERESLKQIYQGLTGVEYNPDKQDNALLPAFGCTAGLMLAPASGGLSLAACALGLGMGGLESAAESASAHQREKILAQSKDSSRSRANQIVMQIEKIDLQLQGLMIIRAGVYEAVCNGALLGCNEFDLHYSMIERYQKAFYSSPNFEGQELSFKRIADAMAKVKTSFGSCENAVPTVGDLTKAVMSSLSTAELQRKAWDTSIEVKCTSESAIVTPNPRQGRRAILVDHYYYPNRLKLWNEDGVTPLADRTLPDKLERTVIEIFSKCTSDADVQKAQAAWAAARTIDKSKDSSPY